MRYVYLVRAGENRYKIGVSRNVEKRIAALQTSNIDLVELVCAKRTTDDSLIEKALHRKVKQFGGTGGTEWFHLSPEQAIEVAIEISKAPDVDVAENIIQDLKKEITGIVHAYEERLTEERRKIEEERAQLAEAKRELSRLPRRPAGTKPMTPSVDREALRREEEEKMYATAKELVLSHNHVSTSFLQRRMRIGYGRAARLVERMEEEGLISPLDGIRREVVGDVGTAEETNAA